MKETRTVERRPIAAKRSSHRNVTVGATLALAGLALVPASARAIDGCLVLLCLAAPNWRAIPQCVSPVRQVLRDLARGRPFPTCAMSGAGNTGSHQWAHAPGNCPPQYTRLIPGESDRYDCDYTGVISVSINGAPWSRTWWSIGGDSVTEFMPQAKAQVGAWDTRFDDDHQAWLSSLPPPQPSCPGC